MLDCIRCTSPSSREHWSLHAVRASDGTMLSISFCSRCTSSACSSLGTLASNCFRSRLAACAASSCTDCSIFRGTVSFKQACIRDSSSSARCAHPFSWLCSRLTSLASPSISTCASATVSSGTILAILARSPSASLLRLRSSSRAVSSSCDVAAASSSTSCSRSATPARSLSSLCAASRCAFGTVVACSRSTSARIRSASSRAAWNCIRGTIWSMDVLHACSSSSTRRRLACDAS